MKNIISCSRRTDIPAFYYGWLQECLKNKYVDVPNPMYPENFSHVDLSPENIHSIVLWSKNFENFAKDPGLLKDYNLYFQYTITGYSKKFEPHSPSIAESMNTICKMLDLGYKPEQFNIRIDPLIITKEGEIAPNPNKPFNARVEIFDLILKQLDKIGMNNCRVTTSYISMYGHVKKRMEKTDMRNLEDYEEEELISRIANVASKHNRNIYMCSNDRFTLMDIPNIKKGHCIDGPLLDSLFNEKSSKAKNNGQRTECGCSKSIDIGNYTQKCYHNCVYCYATK